MKNKNRKILKPLCCAFQVLALAGSYHGDTLGAMEAQFSSPYTGPLQQPWYKGRGCFLDPPKVEYVCGRWRLQAWKFGNWNDNYATSEELFSESRCDAGSLTGVYEAYIEDTMDSFFEAEGPRWEGESYGRSEEERNRVVPRGRIGGLILEPGGVS